MRNEEKREAVRVKDYRLWPVWSEGDPVLECPEDALAYGSLMWPDDFAYEKIRKIIKKENRRLKYLKTKEQDTTNRCFQIAAYAEFLREACEEFRRMDYIGGKNQIK